MLEGVSDLLPPTLSNTDEEEMPQDILLILTCTYSVEGFVYIVEG